MKQVTTETTSREICYEISGKDLLTWLRAQGWFAPEDASIKVVFIVPTGADWSGASIDVNEEYPVRVYVATKGIYNRPDLSNPIHHRDKMREPKER